jgi:transcriptional regulator with XRE-family HTH domain
MTLTVVNSSGFIATMATNEVLRGPITDHVVENVRQLRERRGWSLARLAEELAKVGRPILPTGLHRMESGKRRIDVDDLAALALALEVSPVRLLLPAERVDEVAVTGEQAAPWESVWRWAVGEQPFDVAGPVQYDPRVVAFIEANRPFELRPSVREAGRFLAVREPAPFTARIRNDGVKTSPSLTYGDE